MFKKHLAFIGIVIAVFVAFIDYMIVNNALPSIQHAFNIPIITLQWVTNIYSIIVASTMILFGRLGDTFGKKRIFYVGMWLLGLGSLAAAFSPSFAWLICFRAIQSLGVASLIVVAPGMIQDLYKEDAQKPMGIFSSVGGLGLMLGPCAGGVIVTHWGWHGVFLVNVPILIISLIVCLIALPHDKEEVHLENNALYQLDLLGNVFLFIVLSSLIYTLINIEQAGFNHVSLLAGLIFIISLPLLILVEKKHPSPTLNLTHLKSIDFRIAILCNATAGTLVSCGMFFSPIFLQTIMHISPTMSGVILLSFAIVVLVASPIFGHLPKSIQPIQMILIALIAGIIASFAYMLFFDRMTLAVGIIAFCLTGFILAINNTFSALSAIKGVGDANAGASVGTIFSTFNIMAAISLGIASILLHDFTNNMKMTATHAYAYTFTSVAILTIIFGILGIIAFCQRNKA